MKQVVWTALAALVGAAALSVVGGFAESQSRAAPALAAEGQGDGRAADPPELPVDNSACYVCHRGYNTEGLVIAHGEFEIGCVDCHGQSLAHRNDQQNVTPPERMYAREMIDPMCGGRCHRKHAAPPQEVIARWQERCPQKTNPKDIVCTDCHFAHRMQQRVVRWDKKTGKLIVPEDADSE